VCLDKPFSISKDEGNTFSTNERSEALSQMLHGGGTEKNSMNRWFDKICQV